LGNSRSTAFFISSLDMVISNVFPKKYPRFLLKVFYPFILFKKTGEIAN
jgi:hypothetical protein